ncbi:aliphatic sulfonate ABC transporter substrate-binding protein [Leucobacter tenebrionis]|uniref:aliphatic sulfonate ABC transporter substrate-binding protein n=1 Tax=Leucobacter tenebrionis TaxID=2873270 RepID=UPI001CA6CB08|nr:aliphatic sulfonate ABC transporter substrate-binding protein [Leucobacter tenebrionis]QZY52730.1 aliphatic sulfonate ABC transporter substrate-binding protein [Leucobacter tenebrionis]
MTRRFLRSLSVTAAATAALALGLTGCAGGAGADSGEKGAAASGETIRMGTQPWLGYGQWYVAEDQGFFADRGVEVELSSFNADADVNAALAAGRLDMANVGAQAALQFIEQGVDVSIVLMLDSATEADAIIAGDGVSSVEDLAGKKVGFERGATSEILLAEALEEAGMGFDDIETVELSADKVTPTLVSGSIDAGVTYEPYISEALGSGKGIDTVATAGEYPGLITDVLVVRDEVLEQRPDEVTEVLAAWDDAVAYYDANTDEAREIIATGVGTDASELETAFDGVHFYSLAENRELLSGEYLEETLPALIEVAKRIGLVSGDVDAASAIRTGFLGEPVD